MLILTLEEGEQLQAINYANYYSVGERANYIASHDYLAFYIGGHRTSKTISLSALRNPITLIQIILILLFSSIVLIYYHLFKILLTLILIVSAIQILIIMAGSFTIFLFEKCLNI